jgi:hypothetical protein
MRFVRACPGVGVANDSLKVKARLPVPDPAVPPNRHSLLADQKGHELLNDYTQMSKKGSDGSRGFTAGSPRVGHVNRSHR